MKRGAYNTDKVPHVDPVHRDLSRVQLLQSCKTYESMKGFPTELLKGTPLMIKYSEAPKAQRYNSANATILRRGSTSVYVGFW